MIIWRSKKPFMISNDFLKIFNQNIAFDFFTIARQFSFSNGLDYELQSIFNACQTCYQIFSYGTYQIISFKFATYTVI